MKVLILTYYWPPAGGSGVQRWLKFVKYLRDFDIEPIVYTVENQNFSIVDETLLNEIPEGIEVLKKPIFEPNQFLSLFGSNSKKQSAGFLDSKPTLFGKIARFIRANYFIPDARKFWIQPSVKFLLKKLKESPVDVVITTGPPHSLHIIGWELKKKLNVKWISDFRDPWIDIDYFHSLPLTKKSEQKHRKLEESVVRASDKVIVVGETMRRNFLKYNGNIEVITNGFDERINTRKVKTDDTFSITHIGMMNADRNPKILWKVLSELCTEDQNFANDLKIRLVGKLSNEVQKELGVFQKEAIELIDYVTHKEALEYQQKSQVLLLCINQVPSAKGIITGKIFEYLQSKRPIVAIGPEDGDASEILENTKAGKIFDFDNENDLKSHILELYNSYKKDEVRIESHYVEQYHRRELTKKLAEAIRSI